MHFKEQFIKIVDLVVAGDTEGRKLNIIFMLVSVFIVTTLAHQQKKHMYLPQNLFSWIFLYGKRCTLEEGENYCAE